jgi:hypothetical protein
LAFLKFAADEMHDTAGYENAVQPWTIALRAARVGTSGEG